MTNPNVAILMSTFNGEKYIEEQLDSLSRQTYSNFTLYVRDDGSTDNTLTILTHYKKLKIVLIKDDLNNVGPARSFISLMKSVQADYYFFCDQDDVWLDIKVETSINKLLQLSPNRDIPVLYHSDLLLVDHSLQSLGVTFHENDKVSPEEILLNNVLMIQNCVVGCTSAFNRNLRDLVLRNITENVPSITMHDWWLALYARYFGVLYFDHTPTIYYRQHCSNVSGSSIRNKNFISRALSRKSFVKVGSMLSKSSSQMSSFLECLKSSGLHLPSNAKYCASLVCKQSLLSYITLHRKGVRFSSYKLSVAVLFYFFVTGHWL
jgi:rhamnosyltransferase